MTPNFIQTGAEAIADWLGDSLNKVTFSDDWRAALTPKDKRLTPQAWLDGQNVRPKTRAEVWKWISQPRDVHAKVETAVREELEARLNAQISSMIYSGTTFYTMDVETTFRAVLIHTIIRDVLSKQLAA